MHRTYFRSGPLPDRAFSGHVTVSLPVNKAPLGRIFRNFRLRMRITYFRTGHVTDATSGHVTDVTSGHVTDVTSGHVTDVTSGHVTSGSTTAQHHRKYDFVHTHILLTTEDDERKPFSCVWLCSDNFSVAMLKSMKRRVISLWIIFYTCNSGKVLFHAIILKFNIYL